MKRQFLFGTMFAVALGAGAAAQTTERSADGNDQWKCKWQSEPGADGRRDRMSGGRQQQRVGRSRRRNDGSHWNHRQLVEREWRLHAHGREHVQCIGHELG